MRPRWSTTSRSPGRARSVLRRRASELRERDARDERADDAAELTTPRASRADHLRGGPSVSAASEADAGVVRATRLRSCRRSRAQERSLEVTVDGERLGAPVGRGELALVGREHGAQAGLEPDVHAAGLAPAARSTAGAQPAAPSGSRETSRKYADEFEPEAHDPQFRFRADPPIPRVEWIGRYGGSFEQKPCNHRGGRSWPDAALAAAITLPALVTLATDTHPAVACRSPRAPRSTTSFTPRRCRRRRPSTPRSRSRSAPMPRRRASFVAAPARRGASRRPAARRVGRAAKPQARRARAHADRSAAASTALRRSTARRRRRLPAAASAATAATAAAVGHAALATASAARRASSHGHGPPAAGTSTATASIPKAQGSRQRATATGTTGSDHGHGPTTTAMARATTTTGTAKATTAVTTRPRRTTDDHGSKEHDKGHHGPKR